MKISILLFSLSLFGASAAFANVTYTTSTGSVFVQVQTPFGIAWKDPGGLIWSGFQGIRTNCPDEIQNGIVTLSSATIPCTGIAGSLPTAQQYEKLTSYFNNVDGFLTWQGLEDYWAVFPDMRDSNGTSRTFWTSSVVPPDVYVDVLACGGGSGKVSMIDSRSSNCNHQESVRCVAK